MPARAYSERFVLLVGAGSAIYKVPAGKRAVVKMVSTQNGSTAVQQCVLRMNGSPIWYASVPGNAGAYGAGLMIVYYATDQLELAHTAAAQYSVVCGYLLDAP